ncbi:hypothetical protein B4135_0701 [Caldibacillus debilis]|uniref:Uncharacterized protein n=1 Tax=Caldibacillus debilis TaxID=301148 RepID=A0A150M6F7_9BACI|nr:hypothetical protein B4135_0701 [Caldibacillus debilis]
MYNGNIQDCYHRGETDNIIIEEAKALGNEDIIKVTGRTKGAIEDHFDSTPELEHILTESSK